MNYVVPELEYLNVDEFSDGYFCAEAILWWIDQYENKTY